MADKEQVAPEPLYVTGDKGLADYTLPDDSFLAHGVRSSLASTVRTRAGFNRNDWDRHRSEETTPTAFPEIIRACQAIYRKVGMIRNIVDLMADFAGEGLVLQHAVKNQRIFYREWARRVDLQGRRHDFMRLMLRDANIVVRRQTASVTVPLGTKRDGRVRDIPWRCTFVSPAMVEKLGGELGQFAGTNRLGIKLPRKLAAAIQSPKTDIDRKLVATLPPDIVAAAKSRGRLLELDPTLTYVAHYKKDDWESWATPFLYGVIDDVLFKTKMRLADMAALDGVINGIRIWKLGDSANQILPSKAAVNKLLGILEHNAGGGVLDLVWDDMLDLTVEYPPTDKILGNEKYVGVDADIVRGLGIPDSLVGGSARSGANRDAVFVQLKTLTERLEYVRSQCVQWLRTELRLVADAMGFRRVPEIEFGRMSLRDEAAEKLLLIRLADRSLISSESVQAAFGYNPEIETANMREEQRTRAAEPPLLERAGPYYRPASVMDRQFEQQRQLQREREGLPGGGDNPSGDQPRPPASDGPGRPPGERDANPRDARTTPVLAETLFHEAAAIQSKIIAATLSRFLRDRGAVSFGDLSRPDLLELENIEWVALCASAPGDSFKAEDLGRRISEVASQQLQEMTAAYSLLVDEFTVGHGREPSCHDRKRIRAQVWAEFNAKGGVDCE